MKKLKTLKNIKDKTVLVRVDFNVPLKGRKVLDDFKIEAALPTINYLLKQKAKVVLISHFGRPEGIDRSLSLKPVVNSLEKLLKRKVEFITDYLKVEDSGAKLILLENIRFNKEEQKGSKKFAKELADLGDYFVFESFASSHRNDSSVYYLPDYLPTYIGYRFEHELQNLDLRKSKGGVAVMGGAKISTKVQLIKKLLPQVDYLIVGGALANNFLKALDLPIGKSLYEPEMVDMCQKLLNKKILLPIDVVVESRNKRIIKPVAEVKNYDKILDIGPITIEYYSDIIKGAKTIIWNGPMGVFERVGYEKGSYAVAMAIASAKAKTIVGGGETLAIIKHLNLHKYYNFISTGGGAMLQYLESKQLPILKKLNNK
ncbi:phosphoglycerate kinase [Patescibacteria group bacterium]|nr:phosphoglycerate kinase [Patescibacteria group bacterium]